MKFGVTPEGGANAPSSLANNVDDISMIESYNER